MASTVLFERLGEAGVREAVAELDALYPQPTGASVIAEVVERLGAAHPTDTAEIDLGTYRALVPPWNDWTYVRAHGRVSGCGWECSPSVTGFCTLRRKVEPSAFENVACIGEAVRHASEFARLTAAPGGMLADAVSSAIELVPVVA